MKVYVLIKETPVNDYDYVTEVVGLYTFLNKTKLENSWIKLGKELVEEHTKTLKESIENLKKDIENSIVPAVKGMFTYRLEAYEKNLKELEGYLYNREYIEYYAYYENLSWEEHELEI